MQRLFSLGASRKSAPAPARQAAPPQPATGQAAAPQPPQPETPVAAVAVTAASGESFDFFDEEIDDLLPAELAEEPGFATGDEVDLDSSETPFAFGSADAPPSYNFV